MMKLIAAVLFISVLHPTLVNSQVSCHRCFGNGFCNDGGHDDFLGNIANVTCPNPNTNNYFNDDPINEIEEALNRNMREQFGGAIVYNSTVQHQCITATVHEARDTHTLRTCITGNFSSTGPTLCELISTIIEPANSHNGTFSCRTCNSHFCNTHTLRAGDGLSGSNIDKLSSLAAIIMVFLHIQFM